MSTFPQRSYVLIVIDSGPAGQQVALRAARDRRVALIEQ